MNSFLNITPNVVVKRSLLTPCSVAVVLLQLLMASGSWRNDHMMCSVKDYAHHQFEDSLLISIQTEWLITICRVYFYPLHTAWYGYKYLDSLLSEVQWRVQVHSTYGLWTIQIGRLCVMSPLTYDGRDPSPDTSCDHFAMTLRPWGIVTIPLLLNKGQADAPCTTTFSMIFIK